MDLKLFEHFIFVVERGTFKAAADALLLEPSAIAKQMRQLEDYYGPLFSNARRGRQSLELTQVGQKLYATAKSVTQKLVDFKEEADDIKKGYRQKLRLGIVPGLSQLMYTKYLVPMAKEFRECSYWVAETNMEQQEQLMLQGKIELGFSNSAMAHPWCFEILSTIPQDYFVVCKPGTKHFRTLRTSYTLQDLADVPLCLTVNSAPRLLKAFQNAKISPRIISFNTMRQTSIHAAKLDLGITVYPTSNPINNQELVSIPLIAPGLSSEQIVYKSKGHELSPMAARLMDLYKNEAKS